MQHKIPMTLIDEIHDGEHVDGVKFGVAAIFEYIIEKFSLSEKAKNGTVAIAITIDGTKLEGKSCHVTIGFNIVNVDAVDPNTGGEVLKNMQSDQWCFPVMTIIAKYVTQWNPFLVPKLCLGVGGSFKVPGVVHFCHLCSRTIDDVAVPNHIRYDTCVVKRRVEFYCKDVCDIDCIEDAKTQLALM
jgi:hypothetical protein